MQGIKIFFYKNVIPLPPLVISLDINQTCGIVYFVVITELLTYFYKEQIINGPTQFTLLERNQHQDAVTKLNVYARLTVGFLSAMLG